MRISFNTIYFLIICSFIACALFFTIKVVSFKQDVHQSNHFVASGESVTVIRVVDGDEVAVQHGRQRFVVRILGIKSFDPTVHDPLFAPAARLAYQYLKQETQGRELRLIYYDWARDDKHRVLAYLHLDECDVGLHMVEQGMSVVYERYPFERMDAYLAEEQAAMQQKHGLWAYPAVVKRVLLLKRVWQQEAGE